MKRFLSRNFLLAVAALALVASVVTGREKPTLELIEPQATRVAEVALDVAKLERAPVEASKADPFAARNFDPQPEPQKAAPRRNAQPEAPPLPFSYIGRMVDGDQIAVFLTRGEESLSVKAGQTVGEYRVESVTESEILFTYLPLKAKQSLPL